MKKPRPDLHHLTVQRQKRGWSIAELARRSGLSEAAISLIESGDRKAPSARTLMKLAAAFGWPALNPDDFVTEDEKV